MSAHSTVWVHNGSLRSTLGSNTAVGAVQSIPVIMREAVPTHMAMPHPSFICVPYTLPLWLFLLVWDVMQSSIVTAAGSSP